MKSFAKTLIALFTVTFFIISCNGNKNPEVNVIHSYIPLKNNPVIQILGSNYTTGELLLSDGGRSFTHPHGIVKWINMPFSGVKSIDAIYLKSNTDCQEIFMTGEPKSNFTFANQFNDIWGGNVDPKKIKDSLVIYCYNIDWTDENGDKHTYDPEVEVIME